MCSAEVDCGARAACVSGRCVAHGATAAIDTARRLIFFPVDIAFVGHASGSRDTATAVVGSSRDVQAAILLRFAAQLPSETNVLEAYLLLERQGAAASDPWAVALRTARIANDWDGRSVSWALQPRLEDIGAPVTRVSPSSGPLVRLDVRALVQRWRARAGDDFGVAVVTEEASPGGMAFALVPVASNDPRTALLGPRLEVYVK